MNPELIDAGAVGNALGHRTGAPKSRQIYSRLFDRRQRLQRSDSSAAKPARPDHGSTGIESSAPNDPSCALVVSLKPPDCVIPNGVVPSLLNITLSIDELHVILPYGSSRDGRIPEQAGVICPARLATAPSRKIVPPHTLPLDFVAAPPFFLIPHKQPLFRTNDPECGLRFGEGSNEAVFAVASKPTIPPNRIVARVGHDYRRICLRCGTKAAVEVNLDRMAKRHAGGICGRIGSCHPRSVTARPATRHADDPRDHGNGTNESTAATPSRIDCTRILSSRFNSARFYESAIHSSNCTFRPWSCTRSGCVGGLHRRCRRFGRPASLPPNCFPRIPSRRTHACDNNSLPMSGRPAAACRRQ
jgi:hypothetical protein